MNVSDKQTNNLLKRFWDWITRDSIIFTEPWAENDELDEDRGCWL